LKNRDIWLVGSTSEIIFGNKLSSNRPTLCKFFNLHLDNNYSIQQSSTLTAREVIAFWVRANIPTKQEYHVSKKT